MPRHTLLIPLSHDHHEALLIALRLKKGGPTSLHDTLWPTDFHKQVRSLKVYFENELLPHFKLEEEVLFPIASTIGELQQTVIDLLEQHKKMREMIHEISLLKEANLHSKKVLTDFGALLESHVRNEERDLFPKLEEAEKQGRVKMPVLK